MAKKSLLSGKLQSDKAKAATELSPEQVEQAFQQLTASKATPSVVEPVVVPVPAPIVVPEPVVVPVVASVVEEPKTRLSIDIPKEMHRRIKRKIVDTDQTIMQYVVSLIDSDLEG
jgi:hypothetical protein